ncbi:hypothetical protein PC9H_007399 [Pleurotus ostreatus]|uniref:Uncharacterized protein n=1 Tax=Pleurotus ostreatus TaxID=5322 RepID=A0A8H7DU76_PLEOS|nr:uncharacterized protein PC9H_007399 [Pleurotus ostreatus]KAF7428178.1 hypothetical protein PC9H_007399 [Pleurotus ostreatus]
MASHDDDLLDSTATTVTRNQMGRWSNVVRISPSPGVGLNNVRQVFAKNGGLRGIHWTPGSSDLFLEFNEDAGAAHALALHKLMPDIKVRALDGDPVLVEQYRNAMAASRRETRSTDQPLPGAPPRQAVKPIIPSASHANPLSIDPSVFASLLPSSSGLPKGSAASKTSSLFSSKTKSAPVMAFSVDGRLSITYHGETFSYDMKTTDGDPRAIIALLKLSTSDPGTWLTAAAYHRRQGHSRSALDILMALLKFMDGLEVPDTQRKPVWLMLSGCETDMAKSAKGDPITRPAVIAQHYKDSAKWLQKVYGVDIPQHYTKPDNAPVRSAQVVLMDVPSPGTNAITSTPSSSKQKLEHVLPLKPTPSRPRDETENLPPSGDRSAKAPNQAALLSVQRAKRKLEEDCVYEREQRRRLERELKEVTHELDLTKRSQTRLKSQVREEAEARRKAEDAIERERNRIEAARRNGLPSEATRIFLAVARGE